MTHRTPQAPKIFIAHPLKDMVERLTKTAFKKRGFAEQRLLTEWHLIVGHDIAKHTTPQKVTSDHHQPNLGTLYVECDAGFALEFMYQEPQILERISTYFGYRAITRIKMQQAYATERQEQEIANHAQPVLNPITPDLDRIEDVELRTALEKLASHIPSKKGA